FYVVLTLLMLISVLMAKRFPFMAGITSAVGTLTKLFPAVLLVYFIIRRNYRALILSAASMAILISVGIFLLGWDPHRVYLDEVLGRTIRGEIQDPYNVHWNTLQALLRRALVREETLNPAPIFDAAWLFFFLRPVVSLTVAAITFFAILRARQPNVLMEYGALIAMVSLITPSQASYHQFLFRPAIATGIARANRRATAFVLAGIFALICSNVMGAPAGFDNGPAMIFAFPRVYLVLALWAFFLFALKPPRPRVTVRLMFVVLSLLLIVVTLAFFENKRWAADIADGAVLVPLESSSILHVNPRFEKNRLITTSLGPDGFNDLPPEVATVAVSPDGLWTAYATNVRGNWDIALRSTRTGEVR